MKNKLKLIQVLMIIQFLFWLGFGLVRFFWMYSLPIIVMMSVNALIFLFSAYLLKFKNIWIFWLVVAFVGLNALLSITDQVGIYDYISLLISGTILVLLIVSRKELIK